MKTTPLTDIHRLTWTALMAALIGAGAYLNLPIGPVPVSLQTFFVALAGFALGPKRGALAVGLYLLAGIAGLPVFAGGKSGLGHLCGPTGGFLIGFIFYAFIAGLARTDESISWARGFVFGILGMVVLFTMGAAWLKFSLDLTWTRTWAAGVAPFILWGLIKTSLAVITGRHLIRVGLLPMRT
ncbi:biotin transporter BioY [Pseudodesulfovibrio thermohalotolerans]|uniref:biotin transporter BioY n=1 Tax=Pseudodesulfovibrio thermohalotolerans TaxID=2880651 RepID=UPI00244260FD|nr:biotin transporter BioY [Pseudodesulfovibrio thermohalotolerans]WFS62255.1 biotin transporter BioY [Pseudodesulfovibrio thermohalotolerans]